MLQHIPLSHSLENEELSQESTLSDLKYVQLSVVRTETIPQNHGPPHWERDKLAQRPAEILSGNTQEAEPAVWNTENLLFSHTVSFVELARTGF